MKRIKRMALAILVVYLISVVIVTIVIKLFTKDVEITHLEARSEELTVEVVKYTSQEENNEGQAYNGKLCGLETVTCASELPKSDLDIIKELSSEYGVDWKLIESIVIHETGNRTSRAYKELNNVGGLMMWSDEENTMVLRQFESLEESYEFMIRNIKNNYLDLGLTTIEQIGNKYCPVGKNDKGQNQYWIPQVSKIYESLEV